VALVYGEQLHQHGISGEIAAGAMKAIARTPEDVLAKKLAERRVAALGETFLPLDGPDWPDWFTINSAYEKVVNCPDE
jgi:hypothetical protein